MNAETAQEIAALKKLATKELRRKYAEVLGDSTNANNKTWLLKRIAWRLQANAEGGLTERARKRAEELANDADLRLTLPKAAKVPTEGLVATALAPAARDNRLPPAGTILVREYRGGQVGVAVLADAFEHEGKTYPSLSAVAKAITGSHVNGFHFFKLTGAKS
jgi:hypothetical protein